MCELCAGIEKTHVELKKQEDSQWCGENIEIWKENNQAYLGYEGSAFPISFCPYCNQRLTPEEPLTLEELKQMDGEPIYAVLLLNTDMNCWGYMSTEFVGYTCNLDIRDYRHGWLAYRHKPIEEEK